MQNKKLIRFVESFVLLPIISISGPVTAVSVVAPGAITAPLMFSTHQVDIKLNGALALSRVENIEELKRQAKADAIDNYFNLREMPLAGMGMKMVLEAEKNNLDWRLIPAIAVRESTGGKNECKKVSNNPFGWASCKVGFDSNEHAIETIAHNLGGNNPNTAYHYDEKTTKQILHAYNPPSIVPRYAEQVISIMNAIGYPDTEENKEIAKG